MNTTINQNKPVMTATTASCLIRYMEVWTPDPDVANRVQLQSANVIEPGNLRGVAASVTEVTAGDGIVGSAVQQRAPVIYQDLPSVDISRISAESGVEITAVLAFPVYDNEDLVNVILFGFVDGYGAVELWSRDDRDELAISGSFYRGLEQFEYISQHVKFPKGAGLPGHCWKFNEPKMINDPASNPNFIRSFDRDPAQLDSVIGIPVSREYGFPSAIMLLLSSAQTPVANYASIAKVSSEKPTEAMPFPPIAISTIEGSTEESESVTWHQEVVDQIAKTRSVTVVAANEANGHCPGIAIPCFAKSVVDRVVFFMF